MCVYSMVQQHYYDKWKKYPPIKPVVPSPWKPSPNPWDIPLPPSPPQKQLTEDELRELRDLLKRAKQYDIDNNEPDCELEEKKKKLIELAKILGFEIWFDENGELKWKSI